jgi:hypothetical protein
MLSDVLITAIEGGINYWALTEARNYDEVTADLIDAEDAEDYFTLLGGWQPSYDWEAINADASIERHRVTARSLGGAMAKIAQGGLVNEYLTGVIARANRTNDFGDMDAEAADVIVQVACMGTVKYG